MPVAAGRGMSTHFLHTRVQLPLCTFSFQVIHQHRLLIYGSNFLAHSTPLTTALSRFFRFTNARRRLRVLRFSCTFSLTQGRREKDGLAKAK